MGTVARLALRFRRFYLFFEETCSMPASDIDRHFEATIDLSGAGSEEELGLCLWAKDFDR